MEDDEENKAEEEKRDENPPKDNDAGVVDDTLNAEEEKSDENRIGDEVSDGDLELNQETINNNINIPIDRLDSDDVNIEQLMNYSDGSDDVIRCDVTRSDDVIRCDVTRSDVSVDTVNKPAGMEPVALKACGRGTVNEAYLDKFREERTEGDHCGYLFSSPSVSSPSASKDTPYKTGDDIADITSPDINSKEDGKEDWRKSAHVVQIDNRGYGQHRNLLTSMAMSGTENDKNLLQILENIVTDKKLSSTESYTKSNVDGEPTDQFGSCESDEHDAMGMGGAVIAGTDSVMCEEDGVGQGESDERGVDGEPTDQFGSYEGDECDKGEDVSDEFASYESDEHDAGTDSVMCREDGAGQGETEDRDAMGMGGDVIAGTDSVMCREDGAGQGETEDRDAMGMAGDVIAGTDSMQSNEHAVIDSVGQGETEDRDAMGSNAVPVHQSEEQEVHGMKEGVINITPHDAVELQDVINLTGQYLYNANTGEVHNIDHIDISQFKEIYFLDTEQQVTVPQIERQESVPEIEQQETNYSLSVVVESEDDIKEEKEDNTENQKREFGEIVKSDEVEDKSMNDVKSIFT